MQKNVLVVLAIIVILGAAAFFLFQGDDTANSTDNTNSAGSNTNTNTDSDNTIVLTTAEVAQHDNANDCWLIIEDNVYVVTSFLPRHPGGAERITPFCGQDATTAFATQGGQGEHSTTAELQRNALLLGQLGATVTQDAVEALE